MIVWKLDAYKAVTIGFGFTMSSSKIRWKYINFNEKWNEIERLDFTKFANCGEDVYKSYMGLFLVRAREVLVYMNKINDERNQMKHWYRA